jgi:hypothetical protein
VQGIEQRRAGQVVGLAEDIPDVSQEAHSEAHRSLLLTRQCHGSSAAESRPRSTSSVGDGEQDLPGVSCAIRQRVRDIHIRPERQAAGVQGD